MFNRKVLNHLVMVAASAASLPLFAQEAPQEASTTPAATPPAKTASTATAAPPTVPLPVAQPSKEATKIAEINERIAVMSAQLAELEVQAKIASKRAEIGKAMESSRGISMYENFIPSVREINGIDGRIWAVLNVADGNTQTVRVGDKVGAWIVKQILPDSVIVSRGKDTMHLSFGNGALMRPAVGNSVAQNGLPPFPGR